MGPRADWRAVAWMCDREGIDYLTVKKVIRNYMELAASELRKNGSFKIGGYMALKLTKKPARPCRKGVNPFTFDICVFKPKPASMTVRTRALKKFLDLLNK